MSLKLTLSAPELADSDLQALTRDMCDAVSRATGAEASISTGEAREGAKGEPITLGTIALAFLTSGAAVKLFGVFRAYFERKESLEIEIETASGEKLKIRADDVADEKRFDRTLGIAKSFLDRQQ